MRAEAQSPASKVIYQESKSIVSSAFEHLTQIAFVYPEGSLTNIDTSQGLDPKETRLPVRLPPQSPESAMEHEVIGQLVVSVLLKNRSQVVNPGSGVIVTSAPASM